MQSLEHRLQKLEKNIRIYRIIFAGTLLLTLALIYTWSR